MICNKKWVICEPFLYPANNQLVYCQYLHISSPNTHVSGLVLTSTKTVGVQISSTNKSAMLRFVKKMFVELRISFVFRMTIGTFNYN